MLNFASGDFHDSSNVDLKHAQAYTLVHFLLHGDEGRHRAGFFAFLRGAYAGKASSTDFKSAIGAPMEELEAGWTAHVLKPVR